MSGPGEMPPIEKGDWIRLSGRSVPLVILGEMVNLRGMGWDGPDEVSEIRKANGTVWRRPAPDRSDR